MEINQKYHILVDRLGLFHFYNIIRSTTVLTFHGKLLKSAKSDFACFGWHFRMIKEMCIKCWKMSKCRPNTCCQHWHSFVNYDTPFLMIHHWIRVHCANSPNSLVQILALNLGMMPEWCQKCCQNVFEPHHVYNKVFVLVKSRIFRSLHRCSIHHLVALCLLWGVALSNI